MSKINYSNDALEYIAKIADGGMRDAITLMDKCLSYSYNLTMDTVVKALGVADYETMFDLLFSVFDKSNEKIIQIISDVYSSGVDLKLFVKTFFEFILDVNILDCTSDMSLVKIPGSYKAQFERFENKDWDICSDLLKMLVGLQADIKWEQNPKSVVIAKFLIFVEG